MRLVAIVLAFLFAAPASAQVQPQPVFPANGRTQVLFTTTTTLGGGVFTSAAFDMAGSSSVSIKSFYVGACGSAQVDVMDADTASGVYAYANVSNSRVYLPATGEYTWVVSGYRNFVKFRWTGIDTGPGTCAGEVRVSPLAMFGSVSAFGQYRESMYFPPSLHYPIMVGGGYCAAGVGGTTCTSGAGDYNAKTLQTNSAGVLLTTGVATAPSYTAPLGQTYSSAVPGVVTLAAGANGSTAVAAGSCVRIDCAADATYRVGTAAGIGVPLSTDNDLSAKTVEKFCLTSLQDTVGFFSSAANTCKVSVVAKTP